MVNFEKPISQYTLYSAMFCLLHSNIRKNTAWKAPMQSIQPLSINSLVKCMHHFSLRESHYASITAMSNSFHNIISCKKGLCDLLLHTPTTNCHFWRIMGAQCGTKVAPWYKHCNWGGWWKGTSWDKETLINAEIKLVALAVLKLCLSEGISK